ncbi:hypothetical protein Plhal304r1_c036g0110271 [Plasmopara halstedii]
MFGVAHVTPPEPSLPKFSTREARFRKACDANTLFFYIPTKSSLLLPLLHPVSHVYREQDARCLHLLQSVALIPSCKCKKILATVNEALKIPVSAATRGRFETKLRPLINKLRDEDENCATRPLIALQLKEKVAECLRCWIVDPIDGFVLRKEHVVKGMRLDDLVATPVGVGYMRGYRTTDGFCIIVYPWGYGFVHLNEVKKVQQAAENHLKKRMYTEYVAFEHQQLYEQIKGLLDDLPPISDKSNDFEDTKEKRDEDLEVLPRILNKEHMNTTVLQKDLQFLRRVEALVKKVQYSRQAQTVKEPDRKLLRMDEDDEIAGDAEQLESVKQYQTSI